MERQRIDLRDAAGPSPHMASKHRIASLLFSVVVVLGLYGASVMIPPGPFTYLLSLPALAIITITAGVRASDMSCDMNSSRWSVRRNGYIFAGLFAVTQVFGPLKGLVIGAAASWPEWTLVIGEWGFAMIWLTSPNLPPWPKYVWKTPHEVGAHTRDTTRHVP